jgi:hypothetical protein
MHNEFTAIIERDGKWFIAYCPEVPGANGRGGPSTRHEPAWPRPSHSSWKTGGKKGCEECRPARSNRW